MTVMATASREAASFEAVVRCMRVEATDVLSLELVRGDGQPWQGVTPGAHIDLQIPGVGARQYSVMPGEGTDSLWLGVQRDARSRGGSRWVHDSLRPAQRIQVGAPRNLFALDEGAGPVCLVGGGIGITPLLAMAQALSHTTREWALHYCVRSRDRVAFSALLKRFGARVHLHVDEDAQAPLDLDAMVQAWAPDTHFYCCGPSGMLNAFEAALAHRPPEFCHVERFAAPVLSADSVSGAIVVELARSGGQHLVPAERSILDVLLEQGVDVDYSCRSGVCGACETRVLCGTPLHLDGVLTEKERASGQTMMICCSRADGDRLVLDL